MQNSHSEYQNETPLVLPKTPPSSGQFARGSAFIDSLPFDELERHATRWLRDCRMRGHTPPSMAMNKFIVDKLLWFLRRDGFDVCGEDELTEFLLYAREGHNDPDGRWGDAHARARKPISRRALKTYYSYLKVLFNWLVKKEVLELSPMRRIASPECQDDELHPFTPEEIEALIEAARRSNQKRRNLAILWFTLDAGPRAAEVCGIRLGDIDLDEGRIALMGKGQKRRDVWVGDTALRALYDYIQETQRDVETDKHHTLFLSERGGRYGEGMTTSGLLRLFVRLGKAAGIRTRCHPHKMRRTFATEYINNGAPIKHLQRLMGHTSDRMTMKYVYAADAPVRDGHRTYSPADRMRRKKK